ncbi:MAG TPA: 5-oxoprolinase subunit PxpA [Puia sp.]|nr:5-oxoprolinase subunit PxpA [Puia sp.]
MLSVDLNCDMGESTELWNYDIEKDFDLLNYVSSINIACSYHAGDIRTMERLTEKAINQNISIGAHPSFPDKENFGRTNMQLSRQRIYEIVKEQMTILNDVLKSHQKKIHHVKPHGALYNMAAKDKPIADAICEAIKDFGKQIILYGLSGSELIHSGKEAGLKTCSEVFADRTYQEDGSLTPRTYPDALIEDAGKAATQVLQMIQHKSVIATSGKEISLKAETICVHGDGKHAVDFAKTIHDLLMKNNILISSDK